MDSSSFASRSILENRETKSGTHPYPIVETSSTIPSFKTKPKPKRVIVSVSLFKTEIESETDASPSHSKRSAPL